MRTAVGLCDRMENDGKSHRTRHFSSFEQNDYEIGWVLHKDYWGMGIADEVTKELIQYARVLDAESCVIECDERQTASKRIAMKNGFSYEDKTDNLERYRLML
ncbi:MAG: GNAT family N-acetyltransferase [Christensenellaceae bacterium]|nr:GNAT family N-acetyltransferase [Christensenellaceae bacterium]